jgi:hypothetical protein
MKILDQIVVISAEIQTGQFPDKDRSITDPTCMVSVV